MKLFGMCIMICTLAFSAVRIKIQGSTTVNPVVVEASEHFIKKGWKVLVDTQGGSSGGISALGEGLVDLGMSSRPINDADRKKFTKVNFKEYIIGYDGLAMVVSRPVYESGVKAVTKEQLQKIYESKITNWKELGGFNAPVVFFNKEPGRGSWEVFAQFLYGEADSAPNVSHPEVGGNEETRTKVGSHKSAISQLSASWVDEKSPIRALSIRVESGRYIAASRENVENGTYPMRRALYIVSNGDPKGASLELINFLRSDPGQALVKKHGYLEFKNSKK